MGEEVTWFHETKDESLRGSCVGSIGAYCTLLGILVGKNAKH